MHYIHSKPIQSNSKQFLGLINYHFPKNSKLAKCINRNCVKLSYSCMPNVENIVKSHNKKIEKEYSKQSDTQVKQTCSDTQVKQTDKSTQV